MAPGEYPFLEWRRGRVYQLDHERAIHFDPVRRYRAVDAVPAALLPTTDRIAYQLISPLLLR